MYGELQRDMGPYCTVHIALYMFTRFTSKHVFLVCTDETHTNFTLLHMSGLAVGQCWINTLFTEYRETSLVWCHIATRAYGTRDNTGNRLVIFPCTQ